MSPTILTVLDADAFVELWKAHRDDIRGWLHRRCPDVADELTSETFCRAWAGRSTFRPEAGSARGWLFRIAANLLTDHLRAQARRPLVLWPDMALSPVVDLVDVAAHTADRVTVAAALAGLPERYRLVLALRFLADLDVAGTCAATGWTGHAVKAVTVRASREMRDALAGGAW